MELQRHPDIVVCKAEIEDLQTKMLVEKFYLSLRRCSINVFRKQNFIISILTTKKIK